MRQSGLISVWLGLLSAAAWGQTLPGKAPANKPAVTVARILIADNSPETRTTVARLCTVQEKFSAKEATLREVTDGLRRALGVNLAVTWTDLETVGAKQETKVSFALQGVSGDQWLRTALALAAPGELEYLVSDGVVEIHTRAWMEKRKFPRSYTAKPLVEKGFYPDTTPELRSAALVLLCQQMATPEVWARPGSVCKISGGDMIVAAPQRTHEELADLFSDLFQPVRVSPERGAKVNVPAELAATGGWEEAQKKLAATTELTAENQALESVLDKSRAQGLRNLVVDWPSLAKIGATPQTRVSLQKTSPPATLEQVLREMVGAGAQQGADAVALECSAEGVVRVTLASAVETQARIGVYDVRDVVRRKMFQNQRQKPTQQEVMKDILGTLEKSGFVFHAAGDGAAKSGNGGLFVEFEGLLVVRAEAPVHRQLAQALSALPR